MEKLLCLLLRKKNHFVMSLFAYCFVSLFMKGEIVFNLYHTKIFERKLSH